MYPVAPALTAAAVAFAATSRAAVWVHGRPDLPRRMELLRLARLRLPRGVFTGEHGGKDRTPVALVSRGLRGCCAGLRAIATLATATPIAATSTAALADAVHRRPNVP